MNYPALLCVSVLLAQLVPAAGRAEPAAGATLSPALETKIRALDEQEIHAVLAGDAATLERLWSSRILERDPQPWSVARGDLYGVTKTFKQMPLT